MSYICGRLGSIYVLGTEINNFFFERSGFPISEAASRAKQCFQSKFRNSTNDFDFQNSIEVSVTLEFSDSAPENDAKSDVESEGSGFGFSADENADAVGTAAGNPESGEDSEGFAFSDVEGGAASAADHPHATASPRRLRRIPWRQQQRTTSPSIFLHFNLGKCRLLCGKPCWAAATGRACSSISGLLIWAIRSCTSFSP